MHAPRSRKRGSATWPMDANGESWPTFLAVEHLLMESNGHIIARWLMLLHVETFSYGNLKGWLQHRGPGTQDFKTGQNLRKDGCGTQMDGFFNVYFCLLRCSPSATCLGAASLFAVWSRSFPEPRCRLIPFASKRPWWRQIPGWGMMGMGSAATTREVPSGLH